jgi:Holliday junction resolvase RusA-like endonuclease
MKALPKDTPAVASASGAHGAEWRGSIRLVILGQPASLKNSREIIKYRPKGAPKTVPLRFASVPSKECKQYMKDVRRQVPERQPWLTGKLAIYITAYFRDERSDLDVEALYDALQGWIYKNDRQLRRKYLDHGIDKLNPRTEVLIEPLQAELL